LLVVIAIIAILAGLLLPALGKAKESARKTQAKTEVKNLAAAITQYESTYSRYPSAKWSELEAANAGSDLTFGLPGVHPVYVTNSELMIILMDRVPDPMNFNVNHARNPREILFMAAKVADYSGGPGVGDDLMFRDPWNNPYVIIMDLNGDNRCEARELGNPSQILISAEAPVAVFSNGPDGETGINTVPTPPMEYKDNINSWE
jgi:type II secretory pathway pseudopilin PulG